MICHNVNVLTLTCILGLVNKHDNNMCIILGHWLASSNMIVFIYFIFTSCRLFCNFKLSYKFIISDLDLNE